jgi:hypothetical protein
MCRKIGIPLISPFSNFFRAVNKILDVEKFIIDSKIEKILQIIKFVLNLKENVVNMNIKSIIGNIFNKCKDKRGIKLTNNFEEYTDFRMIID